MTISRPLLIGIVGFVAVAGLYFYTRQSATTQDVAPTTSNPTAKHPTPKSSANQGQKAKDQSSANEVSLRSLPAPVALAMAKNKVVILLFSTAGDPEDDKVKTAVEKIAGGDSKVAAFYASPRDVARYSMVSRGVTRSPAVVVVDRDNKARTVQGYTDYQSILQMVKDVE